MTSALATLTAGSNPSVGLPGVYSIDSNREVNVLENTSGSGGAGSGEAL
jgi:hypothetical protein